MSDPAASTPTKYPPTLQPSLDPVALNKSVQRLNEIVELVTGQRGPATYSLAEGLLEIRKQNANTSASIRELNEVVVAADEALAQRTLILEAEVSNARGGETDLLARLTTIDTARANGDTAVAAQVVTAEAHATGGSAAAQMRIVAEAAPTGFLAQYAVMLHLSGVDHDCGVRYKLDSSGVGTIENIANKWQLTDPSYLGGVAGNVVTYSTLLGRWIFGVPFGVATNDIRVRAVSAPRVVQSTGASFASMAVTDFEPGSDLLVIGIASTTTSYRPTGVAAFPSLPYLRISLDGVLQAQEFAPISIYEHIASGTANLTTGAVTFVTETWWQAPQAICSARITTTSSSHTVAAYWEPGSGMPNGEFTLLVWEFKR